MTIAGVLAAEVPDPKWATTLAEATTHLEASIDQIQLHIPAFKSFILPGSPSVSAFTHVRAPYAEKPNGWLRLLAQILFSPKFIIYLNRLSDYLFVLARYMCTITGSKEDFFL
jgi:cob(I)alamin adenosyltransferase